MKPAVLGSLSKNQIMKHGNYPGTFLFAALLAVLLGALGCAATKSVQTAPTSAAPKQPEQPPVHTVSRGSLKPKVQTDAVFQSVEMTALKLEPKAWADFTVLEAVPQGARVKKGDVLVKLDTEKLSEQIADLEAEQAAAALTRELAAAELENLTQTTPQKLEAARRAARIAREELEYFEKTGREQREKGSRMNLKSSQQALENAQEELRQLEKMYKNDDLVEETEEIVLKRQRFAVEMAQFNLERMKLAVERDLEVLIPREAENVKAQNRDQELARILAEETLERTLAKKRLDFEKMKRDQKKAEKRLADLKKDLEMMTVRAPCDGMVFYGACEGGRWTTASVIAKKLVPSGKLLAQEVFMTVVNPERLTLKAVISEADLAKYKPGMSGHAVPTALPDARLPVKLDEMSTVPLPGGGFEATFSLATNKPPLILPGMSAKITVSESARMDVLLVPAETVVAEGDQKFVWRMQGNGQPEKRAVKTGASDGRQVEILEGLAEGDRILLKPPK